MCFDVSFVGQVVGQVPAPTPEIDDNLIILQWPWFLDFDVQEVIVGDLETGRLTVLARLHDSYRTDLGPQRFWLRNNTNGGYNLVRSEPDLLEVCDPTALPAPAIVRRSGDRTLEDIRQEAEQIDRDSRM